MAQIESARLSLVVIPLNLATEVYLLWSDTPHYAVKFIATAMLVMAAAASFLPRFSNGISGGTYVLMFLSSVLICFVEYWIATRVAARFNPEFDYTAKQVLQVAVVYAVAIGLPVMLLDRMGKVFGLLQGLAAPTEKPVLIQPLNPAAAKSGGAQSGCSTQVLLLLAASLIGVIGEALFSREEVQSVFDGIFIGLIGPAFVLIGGLMRGTLESEGTSFIVWSGMLLAQLALMIVLTAFVNMQFVVVSRLAGRIAASFVQPAAGH